MAETIIGGFELIEKIGEGGMGAVYKASQTSLDRIVALKILSPHFIADSSDVERFKLEARAAAKLSHDGIVQVYDAGEADGYYYFAMAYIEGSSVGAWLCEQGVIAEKDALAITQAVAEALDHAWQTAGIIHRDIKPDNVLIAKDGTVKVVDLGLAKMTGVEKGVTMSDVLVGTPNYCSPEQSRGEEDLDCRADIYSLGAMLYHMVTGHLPFGDSEGAGAMVRHITDYLDDPRNLNPDVRAPTARLIHKMMAKDPADRYQDWREALAHIRRAVQGRLPTSNLLSPDAESTARLRQSSPSSPRKTAVRSGPAGRPRKKDRSPLMAITTVLAIMVAAGTLLGVLYQKEQKRKRAAVLAARREEARAAEVDRAKKAAKKAATRDLNRKARDVISAGNLDKAAAVHRGHDGSSAQETGSDREEGARNLEKQKEAFARNDEPGKEPTPENDMPAEWTTLNGKWASRRKEIEEEYARSAEEAHEHYVDSLTKLEHTYVNKGYLKAVVAVREERDQFETSPGFATVPGKDAPQEVEALHRKCRDYLARITSSKDQQTRSLDTLYAKKLILLEKELTTQLRIDEALLVNENRMSFAEGRGIDFTRPKPEPKPKKVTPAKKSPMSTLKRGLIVHYSFDNEARGMVTDESDKRNHARLMGARLVEDGKSGGSCLFNGNGDYIEIIGRVLSHSKSAISVSAWIKPSPHPNGAILSQGSWNHGMYFDIQSTGSKLRFNTQKLQSESLGGLRVWPDQWNHIVAICTGSRVSFAVNGEKYDSEVTRVDSPSTGPLNIGREQHADGRYFFSGQIDEFMVWKRALSTGEVQELYDSLK